MKFLLAATVTFLFDLIQGMGFGHDHTGVEAVVAQATVEQGGVNLGDVRLDGGGSGLREGPGPGSF